MRNTGLEETQAGIKIARRNFNNLRYEDNTTPLLEKAEEPEIKLPTSAGSWKNILLVSSYWRGR